ncbi:MAG: flagellar protein FlaG [Treponema sp.]|nr:flagellar protein FlaG [Treponema sp.]
MNTIGMNGMTMAMDGRNVYSTLSMKASSKPAPEVETPMASSAAEVLHNLETNKADIEASVREMQRLSDMVTGHKLRFNVNSELDKVVVTVVNASTNEVIRQIPSEDVQKIQARMKQAIGVLFDEII